jgi:hypothetical protein
MNAINQRLCETKEMEVEKLSQVVLLCECFLFPLFQQYRDQFISEIDATPLPLEHLMENLTLMVSSLGISLNLLFFSCFVTTSQPQGISAIKEHTQNIWQNTLKLFLVPLKKLRKGKSSSKNDYHLLLLLLRFVLFGSSPFPSQTSSSFPSQTSSFHPVFPPTLANLWYANKNIKNRSLQVQSDKQQLECYPLASSTESFLSQVLQGPFMCSFFSLLECVELDKICVFCAEDVNFNITHRIDDIETGCLF